MKLFNVYPLLDVEIVRAKGSTLWDKNGKQYLDFYGGHAVISIGHTNDHYVKALNDQLSKIGFYSNSVIISAQQELADLLGRLSGKTDYQLFMCNSGAEANENALKLASFHTGRRKIVAFTGAFHGRTSLAVAATDNPKIIAPVNETDNVIFSKFNDSAALRELFASRGNEIAAVITEGIQGVGGVQQASVEFLRTIRELCTRDGAIYVADSVQCGCGRSGSYFSHDWAGVNADIYTMAKGIANGFPMGALLISPSIEPSYGMLGTTFGGNHLACAAAKAVANEMLDYNLMDNAKQMGNYLLSELNKIKSPMIKEIRGRGLMIGIEFNENCAPIRSALLNKYNIFVGSASSPRVIRLLPALNITKTECDMVLYAIKKEALL
ncbi:MAG: aminotransferase class III-fold pyridoxal phosphate-dependent enzyme [Mucinivorans sp.]